MISVISVMSAVTYFIEMDVCTDRDRVIDCLMDG